MISIIALSSPFGTLMYLDYLEQSNNELKKYLKFFSPVICKITFNFGLFWLFYAFLTKYEFKKFEFLKIFSPWSRLGNSKN